MNDWISALTGADAAEWLIVAAYGLAALSCGRAAVRAQEGRRDPKPFAWAFLAGMQTLFGMNKVLDLQVLLTSLGREYAKQWGWYGVHRGVQYAFVLVLIGLFGCGLAVSMILTKNTHPALRLATLGMAMQLAFVLIRAAEIHHLNDLFASTFSASVSPFFELSGIILVLIAGILFSTRQGSKRPSDSSG